MTADDRGEPGRQRTVAELLKQYGGEDQSTPRRRRRAADGDDSPAPPAAAPPSQRSEEPPPPPPRERGVDRVTGSFSSFDFDPPTGPGSEQSHPSAAGPDGADWTGTGSFPAEPYRSADSFRTDSLGDSYRDPYPSATGSESYLTDEPYRPSASTGGDIYGASLTNPTARPEESTDFIPRFGDRPGRAGTPLGGPADETGPGTAITSRREMFDDDLSLDRDDYRSFEEEFPGDSDERSRRPVDTDPAGLRTEVSSRADVYREDQDYGHDDAIDDPADAPAESDSEPNGFLGKRLDRRTTSESASDDSSYGVPDLRADDEDAPAGLTDMDGPDEVPNSGRPSNVVTWLLLIGQLVVGAIVGAALWIGFRYLWLNFPVVALAAAVVATAGLVLLVRAIRRSDDLQTTMLAVLVGLVVTISPAVLLLASR
jgi:hypothetical protein